MTLTSIVEEPLTCIYFVTDFLERKLLLSSKEKLFFRKCRRALFLFIREKSSKENLNRSFMHNVGQMNFVFV